MYVREPLCSKLLSNIKISSVFFLFSFFSHSTKQSYKEEVFFKLNSIQRISNVVHSILLTWRYVWDRGRVVHVGTVVFPIYSSSSLTCFPRVNCSRRVSCHTHTQRITNLLRRATSTGGETVAISKSLT